jgi:hypothetical protein
MTAYAALRWTNDRLESRRKTKGSARCAGRYTHLKDAQVVTGRGKRVSMVDAHPDGEGWGRTHRLSKCDSEQARAEEEKTSNSYSEETVRSEFFTCHGTPPAARQCSLPPAIGSSRLAETLERLRLMTQLYVGTHPIPKGIGRVYGGLDVCLSRPSFWTFRLVPS